jgi:hypothetical protein
VGATSNVNGAQNTADLVADGNSTVYPAAHYCNDLVIGGFTDWYLPAWNELEICYYNMKPDTNSNNTSWGANTNAVPARASNYTAGDPARTPLTDWQFNQYPGPVGAECFVYNGTFYWSSTCSTGTNTSAKAQRFQTGTQYNFTYKTNGGYVRGMRKVAV